MSSHHCSVCCSSSQASPPLADTGPCPVDGFRGTVCRSPRTSGTLCVCVCARVRPSAFQHSAAQTPAALARLDSEHSLYTPTRSAWPPSCPLSPGRELRHGQASSPCVSPLGGRSSAVPAVQCLETAASNIWLIFSEGRRGNDHSIVAKAFAVYSLMERDSRYIHIKNTTCHNICHQQR